MATKSPRLAPMRTICWRATLAGRPPGPGEPFLSSTMKTEFPYGARRIDVAGTYTTFARCGSTTETLTNVAGRGAGGGPAAAPPGAGAGPGGPAGGARGGAARGRGAM